MATITAPAMAEQQTPALSTINTVELNSVFDSSQAINIQALELSNQEMKDTQGALAPWIIGGAMYSYGVWRGNYQWNTTRFLGNAGTSALISGTFGTAAGSGLSVGANVWRVNSFSANFGVNSMWRH